MASKGEERGEVTELYLPAVSPALCEGNYLWISADLYWVSLQPRSITIVPEPGAGPPSTTALADIILLSIGCAGRPLPQQPLDF